MPFPIAIKKYRFAVIPIGGNIRMCFLGHAIFAGENHEIDLCGKNLNFFNDRQESAFPTTKCVVFGIWKLSLRQAICSSIDSHSTKAMAIRIKGGCGPEYKTTIRVECATGFAAANCKEEGVC